MRILTLLLMSIALISCSTMDLNERADKTMIVQRPGFGAEVNCKEPAPEYYTSELNAKIDANFKEITSLIKSEVSLERKASNLRQMFPEVHNFEILDSRLCNAYANGGKFGGEIRDTSHFPGFEMKVGW